MKIPFKKWIPSIITGASDNDPSGISTYSIVGARFGYSLNWLMVAATPMLIAVEAMVARLADVKRKGLSAIINEHFPKPIGVLSAFILAIVNIATIGADLSGMSSALGLIIGVDSVLYVFIMAILVWIIVFFLDFKTVTKWLLVMVFFSFSYIIAAVLARANWVEVFTQTFMPSISLNLGFFAAATALLGTTIAPYLFFWESGEEVESKEPKGMLLTRARHEDRIVAPGFIVSNIISLFIMIAAATVLFKNGITDIKDAAAAAEALAPFAGEYAKTLFAVGILGAGFLAVPVLATTTAYAIAETFGWRDSLSDKVSKAKGFYTVIAISILVGIFISAVGIDPIRALFYSQVLTGILTPFLLLLILLLCNNKKVMGAYTNKWFDNTFGFLALLAMAGSSIGLFWQFFS